MFTLSQPFAPLDEAGAPPRPSPGRAVLPGDFAGRYRLFANGQWSGALDLKVGARGVVTGQFRSDLHGTTYAVTGPGCDRDPWSSPVRRGPPRARQEFDGYLFGEGKGALAGTVQPPGADLWLLRRARTGAAWLPMGPTLARSPTLTPTAPVRLPWNYGLTARSNSMVGPRHSTP